LSLHSTFTPCHCTPNHVLSLPLTPSCHVPARSRLSLQLPIFNLHTFSLVNSLSSCTGSLCLKTNGQRTVDAIRIILGYYAASSGLKPTFRVYLTVPSSSVKLS
jgi:hypothetical protein